jgi:glycosyltransferase involved in cell wall biosynthesis
MRISHFAQPLCQHSKTGIGWYTYRLIFELAQMNIEGDVCAFDVLNRHNSKEQLESLFQDLIRPSNIDCRINQYTLNGLYSRLDWLYSHVSFETLFRTKVDIHHAHNFFLPYKLHTPSVVTIYDMVYKLYPETMDQDNLDLLNKIMPRSVRDSTKILTISENSKREISEILNIDPNKISIAYPGFDPNIFKVIAPEYTQHHLDSLKIKKPFILYLGTLEPRKNIERIIDAYASLTSYHKTFDLVLAGSIGWKSESIFERIEKYNLKENVHITGYISQSEQVALYNRATCFVFPSLYEGFGMPALEAMACGCPVIASNASSLPEVVGNAGLLVDPLNTDELSAAIQKVLDDESLQLPMKIKNQTQVQNFSWQNTAESVLNLYKTLI